MSALSKNESANAEKSAAGGGESQTNVWWHDADSSRRRRAVLIFREGWVCAKTEDGERRDARLKEMEISPRIGNAPRRLAFADGVLLSADDNDFIDAMLKLHGGRRASFFLHLIESRGRIIIAAIAGAILLAAAAVFYGVPAAAKIAAGAVSHEYLTEISEDIYAELRRRNYIPASKLPPATAARIEKIFAETVSDYQDSGYDYRLRFHEFPPNAFAFPDGLVVMSDALAALLSEDELRAVFAHEAGHVELRHGMRAFLESAGVAAFLTFAGGDWTGLAAGTVLLNLKYSRDHEREADCFAYRYLQRHRMSGALLGDSLQKMNDAHAQIAVEEAAAEKAKNEIAADEKTQNAESENEKSKKQESKQKESANEKTASEKTASGEITNEEITNENSANEKSESGGALSENGGQENDSDAGGKIWRAVLEALSTHPDTGARRDLAAACGV